MGFEQDDDIDELVAEIIDLDEGDDENPSSESQLTDEADGTCTAGYDNDGSTGYDIFQNGYDLAVKACGEEVHASSPENTNQYFFFIGTKDVVLDRLRKFKAELEKGD